MLAYPSIDITNNCKSHPVCVIPKIDYGQPLISMNFQLVNYQKGPIEIVPFNTQYTNCGDFHDIDEAMVYIFKHCEKHHGNTKKSTCFRYLKFAMIPDLIDGDFIQLSDINSKSINSSYNRVCRRFSNQNLRK